MAKEKGTTQPTEQDERTLNSVIENEADIVELRGKKVKVRWLGYFALRKMTKVMLDEGADEQSVLCKSVAAIKLNGYWKIKFLWWALWRWYFYVKQYTEKELLPIVECAKKKVPLESYLTATILLTAMKDTAMQMTRKEAENILQGRYGAASGS